MIPSWLALGLLLILIGFGILMAGSIYHAWILAREHVPEPEFISGTQREAQPKFRSGGLVMIGPFPIAWGTDVPSLTMVLVLGLMLMGLLLIILPWILRSV